jgi:hypothetical protein
LAETLSLVLNLLGVGATLYALWMFPKWMKRARSENSVQFRNLKVASYDPRLSFDGAKATVVLETDESYDNRGGVKLITRRICKNRSGSYFLVILGEEKPYVTHLSRERAKNALRPHKEVYDKEFGSS